ncbi:MAG TPA: hypothetical protein VJJ83_01305, partial [Candidatus Babeliales bacterium]|nr:hypothetical protein [Candidatus Babeliales bacterium]
AANGGRPPAGSSPSGPRPASAIRRTPTPTPPASGPVLPLTVQRDLAQATEERDFDDLQQQLFTTITSTSATVDQLKQRLTTAQKDHLASWMQPVVTPRPTAKAATTHSPLPERERLEAEIITIQKALTAAQAAHEAEILQKLQARLAQPDLHSLSVRCAELNRPKLLDGDPTPSTLLQIAASRGYSRIADLLIANGAELGTLKRVKTNAATTTTAVAALAASTGAVAKLTAAELALANGYPETVRLLKGWDRELLYRLQTSVRTGNHSEFNQALAQFETRSASEPTKVAAIANWLAQPDTLAVAAHEPKIFDFVLTHQLSLPSCRPHLSPTQQLFNLLYTSLAGAVKNNDPDAAANIMHYAHRTDPRGQLTAQLILHRDRFGDSLLHTATEQLSMPLLTCLWRQLPPDQLPDQARHKLQDELGNLAKRIYHRNTDEKHLPYYARNYTAVKTEQAALATDDPLATARRLIEQEYQAIAKLLEVPAPIIPAQPVAPTQLCRFGDLSTEETIVKIRRQKTERSIKAALQKLDLTRLAQADPGLLERNWERLQAEKAAHWQQRLMQLGSAAPTVAQPRPPAAVAPKKPTP